MLFPIQIIYLSQIGNLVLQADFQKILHSAHRTQGFLFAPGTKKNINSHLRQFVLFCCKFDRTIVPASRDTLVAFFELFSLTSSYDHLKNVYSSIKFLHRAINQPFLENEFQVNTVLQSLKRKLAKVPFQVLPITPKILCDMYNFIDINSPADLATWSSFLVAFYCLFRKANVAPKSLSSFDPKKELSRKKFSVLENDIILVYSNHSKTNQFMNSEQIIPLVKNSNNIPDDNPAFSYFEGGSLKCVTYDFFIKRLKSLLSLAGYSPDLYSGHSMRRGGSTLLFQLGCNPLLIQALGDWKSDQFLKYCGLSLDQRFSAQILMSSYCQ